MTGTGGLKNPEDSSHFPGRRNPLMGQCVGAGLEGDTEASMGALRHAG